MISMLDVIILFIVGMAIGAGIVAFLWLSVIEKAKDPDKEVAIDAWLIAHRFTGRTVDCNEERMEQEARRWWKAWQAAFVCSEKKEINDVISSIKEGN